MSVAADKSEWEPFGEGVEDLVRREIERGDVENPSGDLNKDIRDLAALSRGKRLLLGFSRPRLEYCKGLAKLEKLNIMS